MEARLLSLSYTQGLWLYMETTMKNVSVWRCSVCMIIATVMVCLPSTSLAIVGGTMDYSDFSDPTSEWYGMSMEGIVRARSGSAVAVGNRWFLTARHFALAEGNTMTAEDGSIYTITDIYTHSVDGSPVDLRLVRVAEETDFWYDIWTMDDIMADPVIPGEGLIVAGTGYDGTVGGFNGRRDQFVWEDTTTRDWRWGTTELELYHSYTHLSYTSQVAQMNFELGRTEYESGLGSGDSGGGLFAKNIDGDWELLGINAYIDARVYAYDTSRSIFLPEYVDWINSYIPDGDFDDNGTLDADDIDALFAVIDALGGATPTGYELYDLNSDGVIDMLDMDFMIHTLLGTEYGDANLDGEVGILDLGILGDNYSLAGGWALGDFNGDGLVGILDLGTLGDNYGFTGDAVLPEPATLGLLAIGGVAILRRRKHA